MEKDPECSKQKFIYSISTEIRGGGRLKMLTYYPKSHSGLLVYRSRGSFISISLKSFTSFFLVITGIVSSIDN